jgi:hypothetical protein
MRARACIKCKEYVIIHPNNPLNQTYLNQFQLYHSNHTLVTVDLIEIREEYKLINNNGREQDL